MSTTFDTSRAYSVSVLDDTGNSGFGNPKKNKFHSSKNRAIHFITIEINLMAYFFVLVNELSLLLTT